MDLEEYLSERHSETSSIPDISWTHKACLACGEIVQIESPVCPECDNTSEFCDPGNIS